MAQEKSNFGWKVGDVAAYTYRSAKNPHGTVTSVHEGTTRNNAYVIIKPYKHWRFGEGSIKRYIANIRHSTKPANADTPPTKDQ